MMTWSDVHEGWRRRAEGGMYLQLLSFQRGRCLVRSDGKIYG
jgi:hypothetical protein